MLCKRTLATLLKLIIVFYFFTFFPSLSHAEVTLTLGKGSAQTGTTNSPLAVNLENPHDQIEGIQMDICDGDNYISCTGCETTERISDFSCSHQELESGCCRVLLFSFTGNVIEEGSGPILTLSSDVSKEAPAGECRNLNLEKVQVIVSPDEETPFEDVVTEPGEFCFFTSSTTTTHPPHTTTTTTPISPGYEVSISPTLATIDSEATLIFSAKTIFAGEEVQGTYIWAISPPSTIGSSINEEGIFNAGENTTDSNIVEIVKLTDIAHENKSATAMVTIKLNENISSNCKVKINPSSATVSSVDTLTLIAHTVGDECESDDYEWLVESMIGSVIDQEGNYSAGRNDTESKMTDFITVVDHANGDIKRTAIITVAMEMGQKEFTVIPDMLLGSRWIFLPYFLLIIGEDTRFDLSSNISFTPEEDILKLWHMGFGDILIALVFLYPDPQEDTITITISTGGKVATGELRVESFSFPSIERLLWQ